MSPADMGLDADGVPDGQNDWDGDGASNDTEFASVWFGLLALAIGMRRFLGCSVHSEVFTEEDGLGEGNRSCHFRQCFVGHAQ